MRSPQDAERWDRRSAQRWAGMIVYRGGILAAAAVAVVALVAALLVPVGGWHPVIAVPLAVGGTAVAAWAVRRVPAPPVPVWAAAGLAAIAAGHGLWAALTRAEHVVLRRDAGSYALYTQWIATRHGLPVESHLDAFGGAAALADPAFRLASPAFFQVVRSADAGAAEVDIVPQFLLGAPAFFSLGWWGAGWSGLLVAPAVASALALLAFAGLATRLVGPAWAVVATATLAVAQPVLHAARSTYSEPLALLLVAAAACLLVDAVRVGDAPEPAGHRLARRLALAAGATAGLAGLVRVDAVREVALLLPVAAVLALRRHPGAGPLAVGAVAGIGVAAVPALLLSRPYLGEIAGSLLPLVAGAVVLGVGSAVAVRWARRRTPRAGAPARWAWLPRAAGALVVLIGVVLATRPLWLVTRQDPNDPGSRVVAGLQARQGLPIDGGRTYAEHSLTWVAWYLGPVAVTAAWIAFTVLAARAVAWWQGSRDGGHSSRDAVPAWLGPAVVAFAAMVLTLHRPGITPDHPWADRRLVPVVLPAVVLAAVAGAAWLVGRARARAPRAAAVSVAAACVAVLLGPAWWGTAAVAGQSTERGELGAVRRVCDALGPRDVVVALDARAANEWPQVVRGVCGRVAASIRVRGQATEEATARAGVEPARRAAERIRAAGGRPVLLAANELGVRTLAELGLTPQEVVRLDTTEDQRWLTRRPDGTEGLDVDVWLAPWPSGSAGGSTSGAPGTAPGTELGTAPGTELGTAPGTGSDPAAPGG